MERQRLPEQAMPDRLGCALGIGSNLTTGEIGVNILPLQCNATASPKHQQSAPEKVNLFVTSSQSSQVI